VAQTSCTYGHAHECGGGPLCEKMGPLDPPKSGFEKTHCLICEFLSARFRGWPGKTHLSFETQLSLQLHNTAQSKQKRNDSKREDIKSHTQYAYLKTRCMTLQQLRIYVSICVCFVKSCRISEFKLSGPMDLKKI